MRLAPFLRMAIGLAALGMVSSCATPAAAQVVAAPQLDAGFQFIYETKFAAARNQFTAWKKSHPEDPFGPAAVAASYLYEEFFQQGVFTSEFFLDDKKFLGGVAHPPNPERRAAFLAEIVRARELAEQRLKAAPKDQEALFVLTITAGMEADYAGMIEKRQLQTMRYIKEAEGDARRLLAVDSGADDAYVALGAAHYIVGCLPSYKRFFLWVGGVHGDRERGMSELEVAADHGHYLRPFAEAMLALVALREKKPELARKLFIELAAKYPENPIFPRELAKLDEKGKETQ